MNAYPFGRGEVISGHETSLDLNRSIAEAAVSGSDVLASVGNMPADITLPTQEYNPADTMASADLKYTGQYIESLIAKAFADLPIEQQMGLLQQAGIDPFANVGQPLFFDPELAKMMIESLRGDNEEPNA